MQHLRWDLAGRTFSHADQGEPSRFTYTSALGQANVDLGNGQYAPYVWDASKKIVRFADCQLRFTVAGLEFWRAGERLGAVAFYPETKDGLTWKRPVPSVGSITTQEVDLGESRVTLALSYRLVTADADATITVQAGSGHAVQFGVAVTALKAGEHRIAAEFADAMAPVAQTGRFGVVLPLTRLRSGQMDWSWDRTEQAEHALDDAEVLSGRVSQVRLASKVYAVAEEKSVSPDTWGPTSIAADADDGGEMGNATWSATGQWSSGDLQGYDSTAAYRYNIGLRFVNVTVPNAATINSASIDVYYHNEYGGTPANNALYGAVPDTAQWSALVRPSTVTKTSANVAWQPPTSGTWTTSPALAAIVAEITAAAGWASGEAMSFAWINTSSGTNTLYSSIYDYTEDPTKAAKLTIDYTAAGGGAVFRSLSLLGVGI